MREADLCIGTPPDKIVIRSLDESDSLDEITQLLHRSYKLLADMGLKYLATYQTVQQTRHRIEGGYCLITLRNEKIVGTITFHYPSNHAASTWLERPDTAHLSQFAVEPTSQQQGIGTLLIKNTESMASQKGALFMVLDTAEPAGHLIKWYNRLGYEFVEYANWDITNYRSVILSKAL